MSEHQSTPPKIFLRFFRWFCHPKLRDSIEGDLVELYEENLKVKGKFKADLKFVVDVLLLFRRGIIRNGNKNYSINQSDMLKHYFTIGWRTLLRNKGYSLINIGGLALGMSVAMLIGLWIYDETTFNHYYANHSQIAQVRLNITDPVTGETRSRGPMQIPLATALKTNYSHYFKYVLLAYWSGDYTLTIGENKMTKVGQ